MGRSTESDIVKNAAYIGDRIKALDDIDWEQVNEGGVRSVSGAEKPIFVNGWEYCENGGMAGKNKRLYVQSFQKDGMEVFYLNTSEYANGGDESYAVFANELKSVKSFLKDFGIKAEIEEDYDTIQQTL